MKFLLCSIMILLTCLTYSQDWKTYPYHQPNTYIYFPTDEGVHPSEPTEWWYLVGHLNGQTTDNYYTFMLTYFHHPDLGFDGFRIFNLTNETENKFYPQTLAVLYDTLAEDSLNIAANPVGASNESWKNLTNPDGTMMPFKYEVNANQTMGSIDFILDTYKKPLIVGDSGYFFQGGTGNYTYYYSQTGVSVTGTLTMEENTEEVSGTAWIDRQYGTFNPYSGEVYEWFCVHLSNGVDMNIWNIFNADNQIPDTSTYVLCSAYVNDSTNYFVSDFTLQRLQYVFMPDSARCYAQQWNYKNDDADLILTTLNSDREVQVPFRFYEGAMDIAGTYDGEDVSGYGFAELLHSYQTPELEFKNPDTVTTWYEEGATMTWNVLNPDDGNPLYYSLSYSTDGGESFENIVTGITDTSYYWDFSYLDDGTVCIFKLTGSSIDGTLSSTILSNEVTIYVVTSINYNADKRDHIILFPNPTDGIVRIKATNIETIKIFQQDGKMIRNFDFREKYKPDMFTVNLTNEKHGIYVIKIEDDSGLSTRKIVLNQAIH